MEIVADDIIKGLASRQPVIKPNFVSSTIQLASSHVEQIRGILDFLSSIYTGRIFIAEAACYDTKEAYSNFGYMDLPREYNVELVDLNESSYEMRSISDRDGNPVAVRVSSLLLDRATYLISAAKMKTHDTVVVTLSIKNAAVGGLIGDDKKAVHQQIYQTNRNIADLAGQAWPDLASIDGFEGMEGDGPTRGSPVPLGLALASTDALAADRVACKIMGIDLQSVGYLHYCADRGLGEAELSKIEVLGEKLSSCIRPFRLHSCVSEQYAWK